ncbi:threonylcarbamoyl-AMP synthase [Methanobrevibacter sp. TMH8]|uniref:L-threonylcarbamoyladenylate synthase n=1 Tax=Methanobrevibacter sp. TMH8 TaxID=2848611 RepID=UPI001CCDB14C|nr:L-threonylcarbamoyladenylate synthase [Methanobrevibacter sp. TMH8]MBZ9570780.1 threonylcarbamoyl-AMP synthase [Methanobrevibacter sp. TMH8]
MKIAKMNPEKLDMDIINEATEILSSGGVIIYPTDTLYALGANIFNEKAVEKVYNLKARDYFKPISVCVSSIKGAKLIAEIPVKHENLVLNHLPGPFTFIIRETSIMPILFAKNHKIGFRIPDNDIARSLSQNFPITTTSANLSGEKTLDTPKKIIKQLNGDVDYVIDIGHLDSPNPSTVVDLTKRKPVILRQGIGILKN